MKLFRSNIHHENRVKKLSFKLNQPEHVIEEVLDIMYGYIRNKLESVKLKDKSKVLTKEEFEEIFPTFTIPKLGFINPSYKKYLYMMKNVKRKQDNA